MKSIDITQADREEFAAWCEKNCDMMPPSFENVSTGYDPYNYTGTHIAREIEHKERNTRQQWNSLKRLVCKVSQISLFRRQA